jgi:hypothetical protein
MVLPIELYDKISFLLDCSRANQLSPYYRRKIVKFARENDIIATDINDLVSLCVDFCKNLVIHLLWFCNDKYQKEQVFLALVHNRDIKNIKSLLDMTCKTSEEFLKSRMEEAVDEGHVIYFQLLDQYVTLSRSELMYLHDLCWDEYFQMKDILIEKLQL